MRVRATMPDDTVTEDTLHPIGMPCALRLTADREALQADGQDMAHVTAEIVDACGNRVPNAEMLLHAEVTNGVLLGLENGNLEDTQPYALPYRRAKGGRLLLYVGAAKQPGPVRVRVWGKALGSVEMEIGCGFVDILPCPRH
ncbi:hypothetical protein FACS1894196_3330 [Clostridia bacterium]|nr:hypothetical protein FACS1894196_3330 [Clostridia bacterium]